MTPMTVVYHSTILEFKHESNPIKLRNIHVYRLTILEFKFASRISSLVIWSISLSSNYLRI